jgi:transcriptional regulator with XRE-family HTH domain
VDDAKVGSVFRAVRLRRGLSQADVGAAAGVSRTVVSCIERGAFEDSVFRATRRVATVLGIGLSLDPRWRGEEVARLLDARHAVLVRSVTAKVAGSGWLAQPERTFSFWGERGSIDVLAWQAATRAMACFEIKTSIPDLQDLLATMDRKRRILREIARVEGWRPLHFGSVLVVRDETWARNAVRRFDAVFEAALPARTVAVRQWLAAPAGDLRGIWFLRDDAPANAKRRLGGSMRVPTVRTGSAEARTGPAVARTAPAEARTRPAEAGGCGLEGRSGR